MTLLRSFLWSLIVVLPVFPVWGEEVFSDQVTFVHLAQIHARSEWPATEFERAVVIDSQMRILRFLEQIAHRGRPHVFLEGISSYAQIRAIREKCRTKQVDGTDDALDRYVRFLRDNGNVERSGQMLLDRLLFTYGAGFYLACHNLADVHPAELEERRAASLRVREEREEGSRQILNRLLSEFSVDPEVIVTAKKAVLFGKYFGERGVNLVSSEPRYLTLFRMLQQEIGKLPEHEATYIQRERATVQRVVSTLESGGVGYVIFGRAHSFLAAVSEYNEASDIPSVRLIVYEFNQVAGDNIASH